MAVLRGHESAMVAVPRWKACALVAICPFVSGHQAPREVFRGARENGSVHCAGRPPGERIRTPGGRNVSEKERCHIRAGGRVNRLLTLC